MSISCYQNLLTAKAGIPVLYGPYKNEYAIFSYVKK